MGYTFFIFPFGNGLKILNIFYQLIEHFER